MANKRKQVVVKTNVELTTNISILKLNHRNPRFSTNSTKRVILVVSDVHYCHTIVHEDTHHTLICIDHNNFN